MTELPVSVSTDGLESWNDAVRRAEHGETVAVVAHGRHVSVRLSVGDTRCFGKYPLQIVHVSSNE